METPTTTPQQASPPAAPLTFAPRATAYSCAAADLPVLPPEKGQGGHQHDLGLPHLTRCHGALKARVVA